MERGKGRVSFDKLRTGFDRPHSEVLASSPDWLRSSSTQDER
jgi:hypothetical protein